MSDRRTSLGRSRTFSNIREPLDNIQKAINQFDSYLSQPDGHNLSQLSLLNSPIIRDKIVKKVKNFKNKDPFTFKVYKKPDSVRSFKKSVIHFESEDPFIRGPNETKPQVLKGSSLSKCITLFLNERTLSGFLYILKVKGSLILRPFCL